jgi:hypothetical protein
MPLLFGFLLERLESAQPAVPPPCVSIATAEEWYVSAKEHLKTACSKGESTDRAIEDFLSARAALRLILEDVWPERE